MRPSLRLLASSLLALGLSFLAFSFSPDEAGAIWKGYRVLLVDASIPESRILDLLARQGFHDVISESCQGIDISDYKGLVSTSLPKANARIIKGDPRRDSYLEGLGSWFKAKVSGKDFRILYIRLGFLSPSPARIQGALASLGDSVLMPEGGLASGFGFGCLVLYCLCCAALVLFYPERRGRPLAVASLLPGLALCSRGPEALAFSLICASILALSLPGLVNALAEGKRSGNMKRSSLMALSAFRASLFPFLVLGLGLGLKPFLAPSCLFALAASLLGLYASWIAIDHFRNEKGQAVAREFLPVPITGKIRKSIPANARRLAWASHSICLIAVLALFLKPFFGRQMEAAPRTEGMSIVLPQPLPVPGFPARPNPDDASTLSAKSEGELVNMADWLMHRWHEEALFYLPLDEGRTARPFSELLVPASESSREIRRSFGESWAAQSYRSMKRGGVEDLLLSAGSFLRCREAPLEMKSILPLAPTESLLYIILLAPSLAGIASLLKDGTNSRREQD